MEYQLKYTNPTKPPIVIKGYTVNGPANPSNINDGLYPNATIADTPLVLLGKGMFDYGQPLQTNLVRMLENWANSTPPDQPVVGQFWYDEPRLVMNIWNGTKWDPISTNQMQTGDLDMNGYRIINLENPSNDHDAVNLKYINDRYARRIGDTFTGVVNMDAGIVISEKLQVLNGTDVDVGFNRVTNVADPVNPLDAVNKKHVDDLRADIDDLDVYTRPETDELILNAVPPGAIMYFATANAPTGWLKANGALVSRTTYARLFAAIGTLHGAGDGSTTFKLPDLRGEFIRGADDGRGVDSGRTVGSSQGQSYQTHTHTSTMTTVGQHTHISSTDSTGGHLHPITISAGGVHSHSGTTANGGVHNHSASTSGSGDHVHGGLGQAGFDIQGGGSSGTSRVNYGDNWPYNGYTLNMWAGTHTHGVSVDSAGNHNHSISIYNGGEHTHVATSSTAGAHSHDVTVQNAGNHKHDVTIDDSGSAETRPRNVALLACIKT